MQVVDRVVDQIAGEGLDGEACSVAARAGPLPVVLIYPVELLGQRAPAISISVATWSGSAAP